MKTKDLNKQEAIVFLLAGYKVTHKYYGEDTYVYQEGNEYIYENGNRISVNEFWRIKEGGVVWDVNWAVFEDSVILQSNEMIGETFNYRDKFYFQRMNNDQKWYVTYQNRIIAHGQYRYDLQEWIDITYNNQP